MTSQFIPVLNKHADVDIQSLIFEQKVIVIDDFYQDLEWLKNKEVVNLSKQTSSEQIYHLSPKYRMPLLDQVSRLFQRTYYPTDAGWIRSNFLSQEGQSAASYLHSDNPYIVLSVCLSSPDIPEGDNFHGTTFYRHKDFSFKKIDEDQSKFPLKKIFFAHKDIDEMWEPWFKYPFVKNRAIIYDGSLLHKMPWPVFGTSIADSRLMQVFNFRLQKGFLTEGQCHVD